MRTAAAWGPAVLWAVVIFVVSDQPVVPLPKVHHGDKLAHFGAYLLLGLLLVRGTTFSGLGAAWAVPLGLLYGLSDEIHQAYVPGRSVEMGDWIADALGVVAGTLLYRHLRTGARRWLPSGPFSGR